MSLYEQVILPGENITLQRCYCLNPATLLPLPTADDVDDVIDHDCLDVNKLCTKLRPDIRDVPQEEPNCMRFVAGSCLRNGQGILELFWLCASKKV